MPFGLGDGARSKPRLCPRMTSNYPRKIVSHKESARIGEVYIELLCNNSMILLARQLQIIPETL